jgi:hypothetical protein
MVWQSCTVSFSRLLSSRTLSSSREGTSLPMSPMVLLPGGKQILPTFPTFWNPSSLIDGSCSATLSSLHLSPIPSAATSGYSTPSFSPICYPWPTMPSSEKLSEPSSKTTRDDLPMSSNPNLVFQSTSIPSLHAKSNDFTSTNDRRSTSSPSSGGTFESRRRPQKKGKRCSHGPISLLVKLPLGTILLNWSFD